MADVCITEYTDPGCPWAYSAEPFRRRLSWLYGDRLEWRVPLVGLAESPDEYLDRGFTPERQAQAFATIARTPPRARRARSAFLGMGIGCANAVPSAGA